MLQRKVYALLKIVFSFIAGVIGFARGQIEEPPKTKVYITDFNLAQCLSNFRCNKE